MSNRPIGLSPCSEVGEPLASDMTALKNAYLKEVKRQLEAPNLIFIKNVWLSVQNNRRKVIDILQQTFPDQDWIGKQIDGQKAWEYVNNLNSAFYCKRSTSGASKYREGVIERQKGEFCTLCGETEKENLQVDHIQRVHEGGRDMIKNLHLLCQSCHKGKTTLENESVGYLLKPKENNETIDNSLRYYILYSTSFELGGRKFGKCDCGRKVPECHIRLEPKHLNTIYSLDNFKITCNHCI